MPGRKTMNKRTAPSKTHPVKRKTSGKVQAFLAQKQNQRKGTGRIPAVGGIPLKRTWVP